MNDIRELLAAIPEQTPDEITPWIRTALLRIAPAEPVVIDVSPEPGARANSCYQNVRRIARLRGGRMEEGWLVWDGGRGRYLKCVHHAVWKSPDGRLIDMTPTDDARNLFLPDPATHYSGEYIRARYFALIDTAPVRERIEFCKFTDLIAPHPCPCGGGQGRKHHDACEWVEPARGIAD